MIKKIDSLINRNEKVDVLNAITGYGGKNNKTPGYQTLIDLSNYNYGEHTVTIEVIKLPR